MACVVAHAQKAVFKPAAFEVIVELPLDIARQFPALLRQMGGEPRIMLFDDPIEKGLLGPVALVITGATHLASSPCPSVVGHDPRPAILFIHTVFLCAPAYAKSDASKERCLGKAGRHSPGAASTLKINRLDVAKRQAFVFIGRGALFFPTHYNLPRLTIYPVFIY